MAAPLNPADIDEAIRLYLAGKPIHEIEAEAGVSLTTLHRYRRKRGIPTRPTTPLDPERVVRAYLSGVSEYAIAREHGLSRGPISRILREAGIQRRGCSDAGIVRAAKMTSAERQAQAAAANEASRSRTDSAIQKNRRALLNELTESHQSVGEQALGQWLRELGESPIAQRAIGKYNVDLAMNPVAVEVLGGGWHAYKATHAQRTPDILDQGWNLVMVWDHKGRSPLSLGAAEYLVAFVQEVRRNPPASCQYRVVSGDGEVLAARSREDNDFPVIRPTSSRLNVRA